MEYRRLGKAGLKVSELSFGSWITFGSSLDLNRVKDCIRTARDAGINFFDTAEEYADGHAELLLGEAFKSYRREDLVISTKIFWGGKGPNDIGLSWKHLVEGTKNSLRRLQLDYVDLLFCHRPDPGTPIEETVRAMDTLVRAGLVFYWGTSEWSAPQLEEAYRVAQGLNAIPPSMEQPEYNMFRRHKVEVEFASLYKSYGLGTTIWSPLDSGILSGKYNEGIPANSRLAANPELRELLTHDKIAIVKRLGELAASLDCTLAQLAIAWCLKNPHVSSVIMGASDPRQIQENIRALEIKQRLTSEVMQRIDTILQGRLIKM